MTCIGPLRNGEAITAVSDRFASGINARTNPASAIFNSIIIGAQDAAFTTSTTFRTGIVVGPSNYTKISCDSLVFANNYIALDNANTNAVLVAGGQAGTTTSCDPFAKTAAGVEGFLENGTYNNLIEKNGLTASFLGMVSPYYTGTKASNAFGDEGTATFVGINPSLTATSPFLTGASFAHPRLANFLSAGNLTISTALSPGVGAFNNVTITSTGVATLARDLNISGTLTVQTGGTLDLGIYSIVGTGSIDFQIGSNIITKAVDGISVNAFGILKNNGTKNLAAANYTFNGTTAQKTGTQLFSARAITANNAAGLTVNAALTVNGPLNLQLGTVTTGSLLTIGSTATTQGSIDNFTSGYTGTIAGTINFQRFATGSYRHMAAPVSGVVMSQITAQSTPCGNIREFDEPTNTWIPVINPCGSQPMSAAESFLVFGSNPQTYTFTGGNVTGALSATIERSVAPPAPPLVSTGFNALSNPYPSHILWTAFASLNSAAASPRTAFIYNSAISNYGTITASGVAANGASNTIAPGQGFLIRRNAVGTSSVNFNNSIRTASTAQTFIRKAVLANEVRLKIVGAQSADEVLVYSADVLENADKMFSPVKTAVGFYAISGADKLSINTLAPFSTNATVALGLNAIAGSYAINATMANIATGMNVLLEDKLMGKVVSLTNNGSYNFSTNGSTDSRFFLHYRVGAPEANAAGLASIYAAGNMVNVHILSANDAASKVTVVNSLGQVIANGTIAAKNTSGAFAINAATGVYTVRVSNGASVSTSKVFIQQ